MVHEYFLIARLALERAKDARDPSMAQRDCVVAVVMAVTAVEGFLNVYFRKLVDDPAHNVHKPLIFDDLQSRVSLDRKIRKWPKAVFGAGLDFGQGAAQQFMRFKNLRNEVVHFSAEPEDLAVENFTFRGLLDTTGYDAIDVATADAIINACGGVICEILRLKVAPDRLPGHVHAWTGVPQPSKAS